MERREDNEKWRGGNRNKHKRRALFSGTDDKNTYFWTFWMAFSPFPLPFPLPLLLHLLSCLHLWLLAIYYILSRLHWHQRIFMNMVSWKEAFFLPFIVLSLLYCFFMCIIGVGGPSCFSIIAAVIYVSRVFLSSHIYMPLLSRRNASLLLLTQHFCVSHSELIVSFPLPQNIFRYIRGCKIDLICFLLHFGAMITMGGLVSSIISC